MEPVILRRTGSETDEKVRKSSVGGTETSEKCKGSYEFGGQRDRETDLSSKNLKSRKNFTEECLRKT